MAGQRRYTKVHRFSWCPGECLQALGQLLAVDSQHKEHKLKQASFHHIQPNYSGSQIYTLGGHYIEPRDVALPMDCIVSPAEDVCVMGKDYTANKLGT